MLENFRNFYKIAFSILLVYCESAPEYTDHFFFERFKHATSHLFCGGLLQVEEVEGGFSNLRAIGASKFISTEICCVNEQHSMNNLCLLSRLVQISAQCCFVFRLFCGSVIRYTEAILLLGNVG